MLFNSLSFLIFFPLTTAIYFALPHRSRWVHLLLCSCLFYAAFVPAYLLILFGVILIDYLAGLAIEDAHGPRRRLFLIISLLANIGVLASFKYFNFLNANLRQLAEYLHWHYPVRDLGMILPIGLSFHTFQSMAYTIEVYRGHQRAERHPGIYALYVMFYPQLVAGPIERPQHLLPQFRQRHEFDAERVADGLRQMLWGFFKKLVIADRLSAIVDTVYGNPHAFGGGFLLLGTWFFAIQIYCDFSGYSDIAIGAARVLGYRLMTNFDRPYAAQSIAEFWRHWHISLSTWFRDYLYIPLGGSRVRFPRWCFNVLVVFLISGMWHGANWTFAVWGALHGVYLIASRATAGLRQRIASIFGLANFPRVALAWHIMVVFNLVSFAWIFFRARSVTEAGWIASHLFRRPFLGHPAMEIATLGLAPFTPDDVLLALVLIIALGIAEWPRSNVHALTRLARKPRWLRWAVCYALVLVILWVGDLGGKTFIYFQF